MRDTLFIFLFGGRRKKKKGDDRGRGLINFRRGKHTLTAIIVGGRTAVRHTVLVPPAAAIIAIPIAIAVPIALAKRGKRATK